MLSCLKKETSPFKECKVRPRHVPSHVSAPRTTASQHPTRPHASVLDPKDQALLLDPAGGGGGGLGRHHGHDHHQRPRARRPQVTPTVSWLRGPARPNRQHVCPSPFVPFHFSSLLYV